MAQVAQGDRAAIRVLFALSGDGLSFRAAPHRQQRQRRGYRERGFSRAVAACGALRGPRPPVLMDTGDRPQQGGLLLRGRSELPLDDATAQAIPDEAASAEQTLMRPAGRAPAPVSHAAVTGTSRDHRPRLLPREIGRGGRRHRGRTGRHGQNPDVYARRQLAQHLKPPASRRRCWRNGEGRAVRCGAKLNRTPLLPQRMQPAERERGHDRTQIGDRDLVHPGRQDHVLGVGADRRRSTRGADLLRHPDEAERCRQRNDDDQRDEPVPASVARRKPPQRDPQNRGNRSQPGASSASCRPWVPAAKRPATIAV